MNKLFAVLAVALAATVFFDSRPATAGVRIGFGLPLPNFTPTPSHRSYDRGHRRSRAASQHYRKKKAYAAARSAKRSQVAARAAKMREIQAARRERAARAAVARNEAAKSRARAAQSETKQAKADDKADEAKSKTDETAVSEPVPLAPAPATPPSGPVATKVEPALVQTKVAREEPAPEKPAAKADQNADCKKFLPAVGMTVSVPCS